MLNKYVQLNPDRVKLSSPSRQHLCRAQTRHKCDLRFRRPYTIMT